MRSNAFKPTRTSCPTARSTSLSLIALGLGPKRLTAKSAPQLRPCRSAMIVGVAKEIKDHETTRRAGSERRNGAARSRASRAGGDQGGRGKLHPRQRIYRGRRRNPAHAADVWNKADLVIKVKEPQPSEYAHFRPGLILFTYLHLAPLPELTQKLVEAKVNSVAYETIREADGSLPLLTPMSEVAGRMAVQVGAVYLEAAQRRPRHFARRRARRRARQCRDPGRRRGRPQFGQNGGGPGRASHHHRSQSGSAARARRHLQQPGGDAGVQHLHRARGACATPIWSWARC